MKKIIRIKVPSIEDAIVRCLLHNVNMTNLSKRLLIVLLQKIKSGDVLTTEIKNDLCQIMGWNTKNNIVNLMKVLKDLNEKGTTVILITHDNNIANNARRIVRIQDGEIKEDREVG